ncbi:MAG: pilus assembly protein TadG-related protein [Actinomycetota bacterium]|nr:pilus assembly protein TadG-related protein [Actinomycetota bacterium]
MNHHAANQKGQATVLTLVFLVALLAMAAFVLDVGSWYRADRHAQATADAAALAGAQVLPEDPAKASALAQSYVSKNGGGTATVKFKTKTRPNDAISVEIKKKQPAYFSKALGFGSATVGAHALAQAAVPAKALNVAPITIGSDNPQLKCGAPCYGRQTNLIALPTGNYSGNMTNFELVDLAKNGGRQSSTTLANWLRQGYNGYVQPGSYPGVSSTQFNSPEFRQAMLDMRGKEIVVLIHTNATGNEGQAGALYTEVGWAGFVITDFNGSGAQGTLVGYFTSVNTGGVGSTDPKAPYYGVRTISLLE